MTDTQLHPTSTPSIGGAGGGRHRWQGEPRRPETGDTPHAAPPTPHAAPPTRHEAPPTQHDHPAAQHEAPPTPHADPAAQDDAPPTTPSHDPAIERLRLIEALMRLLRTTAFHEVTPEAVAAEAGLTPDELQHHFPTWDGLVLATYDRWNSARIAPLLPIAESHGAIRFMRAIMADNVDEPSLMRFLIALLSIAATPGQPLAPMLHHRYRQFHIAIQERLAADVAAGREPDTMQPARGAEQLIALYEGLQLQSMIRPSLDVLAAFDRAITRLRDGWGRQYVPPVWES